jgi:hypothetical protein
MVVFNCPAIDSGIVQKRITTQKPLDKSLQLDYWHVQWRNYRTKSLHLRDMDYNSRLLISEEQGRWGTDFKGFFTVLQEIPKL